MATIAHSVFFLDVCVLLPQTLSISAKSCEEFLKKAGGCYISSSVHGRTSNMLDNAYDWVLKEIREQLYPYLQKRGINKVTSKDARFFEEFFNERRRQLVAFRSPSMHFEILSRIEHWSVTAIHTIRLGDSISVEAFLSSLLSELSNVYESLKAPLEAIEVKNIIPKEEIRSQIVVQGVRKSEDIDHLASAVEYQFTKNVWVVFVTFDDKHILSNQKRLYEICGLHCCKPDYALDYARDLTREKPPVQYYVDINPKSSQQEGFAKTIKKTLNISITVDTPQPLSSH